MDIFDFGVFPNAATEFDLGLDVDDSSSLTLNNDGYYSIPPPADFIYPDSPNNIPLVSNPHNPFPLISL
jgi:hypothetical protein